MYSLFGSYAHALKYAVNIFEIHDEHQICVENFLKYKMNIYQICVEHIFKYLLNTFSST